MFIRQVGENEWQSIYACIEQEGRKVPLTKQYDLSMTLNGSHFILKVQPDSHRKICVLQALEVISYTGDAERDYCFIDNNTILTALMELFLHHVRRIALQSTQ